MAGELGFVDGYGGDNTELPLLEETWNLYGHHGHHVQIFPRQIEFDYELWRALPNPGTGDNNMLNDAGFSCAMGVICLSSITKGYYPDVLVGDFLNRLAPNTVAANLLPEEVDDHALSRDEAISPWNEPIAVFEGSFKAKDYKNRIVTKFYYVNTDFSKACMEINADESLSELEKLNGFKEQFEIYNCAQNNFTQYQLIVINLPPELESEYEQHDPDKPC